MSWVLVVGILVSLFLVWGVGVGVGVFVVWVQRWSWLVVPLWC